jgi:hypothetical protein
LINHQGWFPAAEKRFDRARMAMVREGHVARITSTGSPE